MGKFVCLKGKEEILDADLNQFKMISGLEILNVFGRKALLVEASDQAIKVAKKKYPNWIIEKESHYGIPGRPKKTIN